MTALLRRILRAFGYYVRRRTYGRRGWVLCRMPATRRTGERVPIGLQPHEPVRVSEQVFEGDRGSTVFKYEEEKP